MNRTAQKRTAGTAQLPPSRRGLALLLCFCLCWFSLPAQQTVSLKLNDASLEEVIQALEKATSYKFLSRKDQVQPVRHLTVDCNALEVDKVLDQCLQGTGLTYEKVDNTFIIKPAQEAAPAAQAPQTAQRHTVTGTVRDTDDRPLEGVTVALAGSRVAAVTDAGGRYALLFGDEPQPVINFTFIGMKPVSVNYTGQKYIDVVLEEEAIAVQAIVKTGIFTREQEHFTGSSVTISDSDLKRVGNQNLFQSLKNLDPSLNIFANLEMGSDPNTLPDMKLRGTSTFPTTETGADLRGNYVGSPNIPLFILDGFKTTLERIYDMDMNRIQSVTILKDAAAKAIYGSEAANGVVVIETKQLLANQTRVTYTGSVTFEMPDLTSYDLCNALEKLQAEQYEGMYDDNIGPESQFKANRLYQQRLEWAMAGNSVYWLSKPLHLGVGHKHSLSVELGEKAVRAIADFSYNNVKGVMKGSDRNTLSGDLSLMYRRKNVLFKNIMSISNTESDDSPYGSFSRYAQLNPYWNPYNEDGSLRPILEYASQNDFETLGNPLYDATLGTRFHDSSVYLNNNFYAEYNITSGLKAVASVGISAKRLDGEDFYPANHTRFLASSSTSNKEEFLRRGSFDKVSGKSTGLTGQFNLQYNKSWGKHNLFANARYELGQTQYEETQIQAEGFPSDKMQNLGFARQYAQGTTPRVSNSIARNLGALLYLSYNYDDRYVLDFTERANAASVFGNDNPWANFWSVGAAWNLHNEGFLKGCEKLSQLKLRLSYGTSGNQNFAANTTFAIYNYNTGGQYNNFIGAYLTNMENPALKWEEKKEFNAGADLSWGPLNLRLDYYHALTDNMVTQLSIVPSAGFPTVSDNLGQVLNKGFEAYLSYSVFRNAKGFLNISGGVTTNHNTIRRLSEGMKAFNDRQRATAAENLQSRPVLLYQEGMPLNAIWAVPSLGIDPMTGYEMYVGANGLKTYQWNYNNLAFQGSSDPKYNGILGINGEYKGFGLSLSATFLGGGKYYNYTLIDRVEDVDIRYNVDRRVLNGRWLTPGQEAQYTALRRTFSDEGLSRDMATRATSRFVQRRNELDLSSLSAYYEFPRSVTGALHLQQLRLSCYLSNVATFSSIKIERGTGYPFARTLSLSVSATF